MKLTCSITAFILLLTTLTHAQLIPQPDEVAGTFIGSSSQSSTTNTPGLAKHTESKRGRWRIYDGKFPSLDEINKCYQDPMPIYGLYTDPGLYLEFRKEINDVGFSSFRVGRARDEKSDPAIRAMIEDDAFVMIVLGAKKRDEFDNDEDYIKNALNEFAKTIERFGPNGQFFKDHPDVPYKPVLNFQILNEPNFQYMYKGSNDAAMIPIRHKLYAQLLPRTYDMIKKRWPEINVVGWTCGGAAAQDLNFVVNAIKFNPRMATAFDVFSTHPYTQPAPPDVYAVQTWGEYSLIGMISKIRAEFAKAGRSADTLPVYYTEGGWRITKEAGGMFDSGSMDADMQSANYIRYYAIGLRLGINKIMPMYIVDADTFNGGIFNRTTGWKRNDKNPMRPVAYAIQNMIRLMPNPKIKSIISDGKDGYFAYEYLNDKQDSQGNTTIMAWNVTPGGKQVNIPVACSDPVIIDMYGKQISTKPVNGKIFATVGPYPIYITQNRQ